MGNAHILYQFHLVSASRRVISLLGNTLFFAKAMRRCNREAVLPTDAKWNGGPYQAAPTLPSEYSSTLNRNFMQRTILGVMAILFLLAAAILWFVYPNAENSIVLAFCWRMGAMVGAAWLAFDDVQRLPGWLLITLPVLAIVLVRWPRYMLIVLPVVVGLAFIHSRFFRR
jgi:hypothetical protein